MLYFVGRALVDQWIAFRSTPLVAHPRWGAIASSGAMVLAVYGLLVQTWRVLLAEAGESLPFIRAAGIWSISNLWRYVPGKLWQIGAMSGLARRENVSAAAAAGSALLSTLLNVATGLAIMLVLDDIRESARLEGDHWRLAQHGFDSDETESFVG